MASVLGKHVRHIKVITRVALSKLVTLVNPIKLVKPGHTWVPHFPSRDEHDAGLQQMYFAWSFL